MHADRSQGGGGEAAWLVERPRNVQPVSAVRGTLLAASREQVRAAGVYGAYLAQLAPEAREELDQNLAFTWVPIDAVHAHYRALDALSLDEPEIVRMTRASGERRAQCELFMGYCATSVSVREVRRDALAGALALVVRWG